MRRNLSIYLDIMRTAAALGVLLGHAASYVAPWLPIQISGHGIACVALFFVLSGFVIRHASLKGSESTAQTYAIARLSRIIPVALLSFATTTLFDAVGKAFLAGPAFLYSADRAPTEGSGLLASIFFVNQSWFSQYQFGTNEPFWSLGFEVPYYVLFGCAMFMRGRYRLITFAIWFAVYGVNILAYLPVWLLGVLLYEIIMRRTASDRPLLGMALVAASGLAYWLFKHAMTWGVTPYDASKLADIPQAAMFFLGVGLCVALHIYGADTLLAHRNVFDMKMERAVRWVAGGSFTLYLCHMPILVMIRAIYPAVVSEPVSGVLAISASIVTCYLLAEVAERRKFKAKQVFSALLMRRPPATA